MMNKKRPYAAFWDERTLEASSLTSSNTEFFDCDGAIGMDGLEVEDDLDSLFSSQDMFAFEETAMITVEPQEEESDEEIFVSKTLSEPIKTCFNGDSSRPHKRRFIDFDDDDEDLSLDAEQRRAPLLVLPSQLTSDFSNVDLNTAIEKLAASMRRSEMSRAELIRRHGEFTRDSKTSSRPLTNVFLTANSSAALSSSLEHSKTLLQSYIGQMKGPVA